MAEVGPQPRSRVDWKAKYEGLKTEHELLSRDFGETVEENKRLSGALAEKDSEIERLNRQVGRAKLEGAKGLATFLLESE